MISSTSPVFAVASFAGAGYREKRRFFTFRTALSVVCADRMVRTDFPAQRFPATRGHQDTVPEERNRSVKHPVFSWSDGVGRIRTAVKASQTL